MCRRRSGGALAQLGIEHIPAYSPEARGRSERAFRTLQDRLPKELKLAGIGADVAAANRFIRDVYLPAHNRRFAARNCLAISATYPTRGRPIRTVSASVCLISRPEVSLCSVSRFGGALTRSGD